MKFIVSPLLFLARRREAGIAVILVLFCLVVGAIESRYLTLDTARIVALAVPLILIAGMGQMMVLIARHVDLSIGSILGFSAIVAGMTFRDCLLCPGGPVFL